MSLKALNEDAVLSEHVLAATADPTLWRSPTFALTMAAAIEQVAAKSPAITTKEAQVSAALAAAAVVRAAVTSPPKARLPK